MPSSEKKRNNTHETLATILVVDDSIGDLFLLSGILENAHYTILTASTSDSAIRVAKEMKPDLILLDVRMSNASGMNGYELCCELKKTDIRNIPVIFLSGLTETDDKTKGFESGAIDYLSKPIDASELLMRVAIHLESIRKSYDLSKENKTKDRLLKFSILKGEISDTLNIGLDETRVLPFLTEKLACELELAACRIEIYDCLKEVATIEYEYVTREDVTSQLGSTRRILNSCEDLPENQHDDNCMDCAKVVCPIFDDQGVIGNLWGIRSFQSIFDEDEINLMQDIATQCAVVVRQARLYKASVKQRQELTRLNKLKDDFLKSISHELKTPMSSITLAVQTIEKILVKQEKNADSEVLSKVIKIFHSSCERQKELIDDLLTLCYSDINSEKMISKSVDLNIWLMDLIEPYVSKVESQKQKFILELTKESIFLVTQPMILERIVREFLYNALKYTPPGETIVIKSSIIDSEISFCVINTGVEISEEEQELIFDQFYRIPNSDPWKYGGTGLGLAIVKKLALLLNAKIDVTSKELRTVFCVRLQSDRDDNQ